MRRYKGKKQGNHKKILFGVGVVLLVVTAIIVIPMMLEKSISAQETAVNYFELLSKKQYEKMYGYLSKEAKAAITKEAFIERNQNIYEGIDASDIQVTFPKQEDNKEKSVVLPYQTTMDTMAGEYQFDNEVLLEKDENKNYKINWTSSLIFPDLEDTDKVKVKTTEGKRGTIYDRNNTALAKQGTVAQVGIVPGKLGDNSEAVLEEIAAVLNIEKATIEKALSASWVKEDVFVPIKKIASTDTQTQAALVGEDGNGKISGVAIQNMEGRVYPLAEKAGHLTGYVQSITAEQLEEKRKEGYHEASIIGKSGLEKVYEDTLRGKDGSEIYTVDKEGEKKQVLCMQVAQDGKDVQVSIDAVLQQNTYDQFAMDAGTAVAMNPKTGELLALVSTPGINPNEFVLGMSGARWEAINNDPLQPLTNRYGNAWVPGSTFKAVTAAIGVDNGKLNPAENKGNVGLAWQKDSSWGNYKVTTLTDYGSQVTLENALVYSDNIYFAKAALDIGADLFATELLTLGFGEDLPFVLNIQASTFGDDNKIDKEIQLADTGYGQGKLLMNPIHMASIYSAFVNEGNMILPVLEMKEGFTPSYWKEQVFTKETVNLVSQDLMQVIENPKGTGSATRVEGVSLLGKTGTAETKSSQGESGAKELGWLACETVNESDKAISIIAMVEDIQSKGEKQYINKKVKTIIEQYVK